MFRNPSGAPALLLLLATTTVAAAISSRPPVGSIINGTCGHTDFDSDCDKDTRGAFDTEKEGIKDLAGCVERVKQCRQGWQSSTVHVSCILMQESSPVTSM